MACFRPRAAVALCLGTALPIAAFAQDAPLAESAEALVETRIFTPADFTRYAPRTAYDMLVQLPGFTIRNADGDRGLGQASENVLINGERVTDKAGGAVARLQNVPAADVARIEVVQAATTGIAGLTGQVANVFLKAERKASGNFEWRPMFRPHFARPSLLRGSISYSGTSGKLGYTLSVANGGGRGAVGGPDYVVTDPTGAVTERRDQIVHNEFDDVRMTALLKYTGAGQFRANLNLVYDPWFNRLSNFQRRTDNGNPNDWRTTQRFFGYSSSASGDVAFGLGPGNLKLIGLRRFEHSPASTLQRTDYDNGAAADTGSGFARDSRVSETIARAEYRWKGGANDWQISLERAYNKLDQNASFATLAPSGRLDYNAYPQGSGIVAEERYEGVASLSRPFATNLDLQLVGGAEYSTLRHLDRPDPGRHFFRPKGSASLAWRPAKGWDLSLKLARRVGQISFYDFLAQPDLALNRSNEANPKLVPPQIWDLSGELNYDFGAWGKTRLRGYYNRIDDIVDRIPVGNGDAVGNLPRATRIGAESKSTFLFDPLGWNGAKLDATVGFERSRVRDPLTGNQREIGNTRNRWVAFDLRHDVPGSPLAWGGGFYLDHFGWSYYLSETSRTWEGPYVSAFLEHKDVAGLRVRLEAFNLNDGRFRFDRIAYEGKRIFTPVSFRERSRQLIGPIFTISVRGTF